MKKEKQFFTIGFRNGKKIELVFFLLPLFLFFSCTKNDKDTIVLLGTESYIDDILDVIPDSLRIVFDTHFGQIPRGYVPPNVEGDFVIAPKQRCISNAANWPLSVTEPNTSLSFTNQHNSVVELNLAEATETFTDTVFVVGHDNLFTVYYQESKSMTLNTQEIIMKRGILIKGEMCGEGIKDLCFANIIMDVQGDTENAAARPGQFFIYKDGDGIARKEEGK